MNDAAAQFETKAKPVAERLRQELSGVHASRPNPKLIEDVKVQYLGSELALQQLGTIRVQPPRDMVVTPWDKAAAGPIAKALETAKPGMNPRVDGAAVRISVPPLTAERREELRKLVGKMAEEARITIRTLRDETNKHIEAEFKAKTLNEDQKFKQKERVQKATEKINKDIEALAEAKTREIND